MALAVAPPSADDLVFQGSKGNTTQSLDNLRLELATKGLDQDENGTSESRPFAWLLLLQTQPLAYEQYAAILERGASPAYLKIKDDVHRTLTTDPHFVKRVTQSALTRILNAVAWSTHDKLAAETPLPPSPTLDAQSDFASPPPETADTPILGTAEDDQPTNDLYIQGMNVIAAPFLFVAKSEPAAFSLLHTMLQDQIPTYFSPGLAGVHVAMNLLQEVIELVDPDLARALPPANTWSMGPLMTLCASVPPLLEVLILWDFLLAAGPHMVVLCVAGMLLGMREQLLTAERPGSILGRSFGPLKARQTIEIVRSQIAPVVFANGDLGHRIITHTRIAGEKQP